MKKLGALFSFAILFFVSAFITLKYFPDSIISSYLIKGRILVCENEKVMNTILWFKEKISKSVEERHADLKKEKELPLEVHEIEDPKVKVKADLVENGWRGLEEDNRVFGPKLTGRGLKGKVVLVYVWNAEEPESARLLTRMQQIWSSFKHKPFMLIASDRGGDIEKAKKVSKLKKLTFPIYYGSGFVNEKLYSSYPFIYVVDGSGKLVYHGRSDRVATEVVVDAFSRL